jgi:hypothetical protein
MQPRRPSRAVLAVTFLLAVTVVPNLSGCNDCDFQPRCEGNVMVTCGGIDQQVGRSEKRVPCGGLNPVCGKQLDSYGVVCVTAAKPSCTPKTEGLSGPPSRCDGQIQLTCHAATTEEGGPGGYEVAMDCGIVHSSKDPPGSYECKTTPSGGTCQLR